MVNYRGIVGWIGKNERWVFGALIVAFCLGLLQRGPWVQPDTSGYISGDVTRSFLYYAVLYIYDVIMPSAWMERTEFSKLTHPYIFLVAGQLLLGAFSAVHLAKRLKSIFEVGNVWKLLVTIILLSPYLLPTKIGNAVLTEGICYPLFLLTASYLLKGLVKEDSKALLKFLLFTALLVLTRGQFLFLYPLFVVVLFYIFIKRPDAYKKWVLVVALFATVAGTTLAERSYHYFKHGVFGATPFGAFQLIAAPLYVADPDDGKLFDDPVKRKVFEETYSDMQKKDIALKRSNVEYPVIRSSTYDRFHNGYDELIYVSLHDSLVRNGVMDNGWFYADNFMREMAFTLICDNLDEWVELYRKNITVSLGGDYVSVFIFGMLLMSLMLQWQRGDRLTLVVFFVTLLTLANYSFVAIVQVILKRYSLYVDGIQVSMMLLLFYHLLTTTKIKSARS